MRIPTPCAFAWLRLLLSCSLLVSASSSASSAPRNQGRGGSCDPGRSSKRSTPVQTGGLGGGKMAACATALDFREMMRRERELALKREAVSDGALAGTAARRYVSKRRKRLDLKRDHGFASKGGVDGIYYVPGFVTAEEGERLQNAARRGGSEASNAGEANGAGGGGTAQWKDLHKRRLQIHGGTPHPCGMVEEELPLFLHEVCEALVEVGVFPENSPPNHVLLNEYSEGQGIGPHKDGPLYEGRVAILSLGQEAFLDFWGSLDDANADCTVAKPAERAEAQEEQANKKTSREGHRGTKSARSLASVKCEDCSLVVFEGQAYYDLWHGIAAAAASPPTSARSGEGGRERNESKSDKRLSFTIRRVARVVPADSVMEHPEARSEMERRRRGFERSVTETGVSAPAAPGPRVT